MIYRPTYSYGITTSNPRNPLQFWTCGYPMPSKKTEANRGGLNKIFNELKNNTRVPRKDQTDIVLNLNDPIYQCPPPTPTPTPTNPYYSDIASIDIIP